MADEKPKEKRDDKKDDKKGAEKKDRTMWVIFEELALILIVVYLFYRFIMYARHGLDSYFINSFGQDSLIRRFYADPSLRNLNRMAEQSTLISFLLLALNGLKLFAYLVSALLIGWIVWLYRQISAMNAEDTIALNTPKAKPVQEDPGKKHWERIVKHSQSENASDWRLAILEADIILDEILDVNGYRGETIGDKLKQVEPSDMDTLDNAWEAHKIRNAIAHDGQAFILTAREARRVIGLYESVFREFEFI